MSKVEYKVGQMVYVGITGQSGFIGTHLFNTLGLHSDKFVRVPFMDDYFNSMDDLERFVSQCDVIVHLAGVNRHEVPEHIYEKNLELVDKLLKACIKSDSKPHIIFSSSTQEANDNPYGRAKREGREMVARWAKESGAGYTGLIIPNVYGPFGQPFYNSVVATFCYQITRDQEPMLNADNELKLIYVGELVNHIVKAAESGNFVIEAEVLVPHTASISVSGLLKKIRGFKEIYFRNGEMPDLSEAFDRNLFNTFLCYIEHERFFPFRLEQKADSRGKFVELVRLGSGGQVSFSSTMPGITRGNHFHLRKAERFAVIKGTAQIDIRRIGTEKVSSFVLDGTNPSFVDMPIWYTHNITNKGKEDLYTIFWISEHYNESDPDTWYEMV